MSPRALGADLGSGVAVGVVAIPQAMAFALVAGVPSEHALYAMIVPGLVAVLIRREPHLATGATQTAALLTASLLAAAPLSEHGVAPVLATAGLIVGAAQAATGAAGLGRLARYVSPAVVTGFTLGAAVLIAASQLPTALGVELAARGSVVSRLLELAASLDRVDPASAAIAAVTLAVLAVSHALDPRLPGAVLAVAAGTAAALALDAGGLVLVGEVPRALPGLVAPVTEFEAVYGLFGPALAIAIVGLAENVSVGTSLARRAVRPFAADRELLAQGLANAAGAVFACLPSSVSWTRSSLTRETGARTRLSGAFAAFTVLAVLAVAAPAARHVPLASVAAVVLWIALRMVQPGEVRRMGRADRADLAVLGVTFLATLLVALELAVFAGVALSLGLVIHRAGLLRLSEFARGAGGALVEIPLDERSGRAPVTLLQAEGDLFFGVADELERRLDALAAAGSRAIVLRLKRTHAIDGAAAEALTRFCDRYRERGGMLILCGLRSEMRARIEASDLGRALDEGALDETAARPFESMRRALERARRHLGADRDERLVRAVEDEAAEPTFSI